MDDMQRNRAETGPIQFGDDWRGCYIRGDSAMHMINELNAVLILEKNLNEHTKETIKWIQAELARSNQHTKDRVQMMKPFKECFIKDESENPDTD